jgi:hypothetical protein
MPARIAAALLFALAMAQAAPAQPEVRFLSFAPSPYTSRQDAVRAGVGIHLSLRRVIEEYKLPLRTTFYDGMPALENADKGKALLRGARVLVFGSSTWAQGSAYYIRRYFELVNNESLLGVAASAWTTAGGAHTGGERVIEDALRTRCPWGPRCSPSGRSTWCSLRTSASARRKGISRCSTAGTWSSSRRRSLWPRFRAMIARRPNGSRRN